MDLKTCFQKPRISSENQKKIIKKPFGTLKQLNSICAVVFNVFLYSSNNFFAEK